VLLSLARARAATLLIVTHDADLAARADRRLELRGGELHELAPVCAAAP
jgi:predicted ABC-type transport system involved in lysophospholipase L1 biosynthesis ATPase subunit